MMDDAAWRVFCASGGGWLTMTDAGSDRLVDGRGDDDSVLSPAGVIVRA